MIYSTAKQLFYEAIPR